MDIIGGQHLRQMWDDLADVYGHKTALICESSGGVVNRYSYLELNQEINRTANLFYTLGIRKGDKVALHLDNCPDEKSLFVKLTNTISVLLAIFIVLRFGELIYRDKLSLAFAGDFYSVMFWIEVLLMLFPLVVLRVAKLRNDSRMLFLSALSALLGCATWRLTYSLVAFNPGGGYAYFPTWEELLISIGFVAIEICAYIVLIRLLPILPPLKQNDHNRHEASKA